MPLQDSAYLYRRIARAEAVRARQGLPRARGDRGPAPHALGVRAAGRRPHCVGPPTQPLGTDHGPHRTALRLAAAGLDAPRGGRPGDQELSPGAQLYAAEASQAAADLAKESAEHAETLGRLLGVEGEPWHRIASGGFLRNAVYGFNNGLTANFGLVMGVLGVSVPHHIVLVSGVAGLFVDALSMGSSGFLAAKSEREVYTHEIAIEREELRLMPDLEKAELALLYRARGMRPDDASRTAADRIQRSLRTARRSSAI